MMKCLGFVLMTTGYKIVKGIDVNLMKNSIIEHRKAIAGVVTAGLGIYTVGRADGFKKGYELGITHGMKSTNDFIRRYLTNR